MKKIFSLLLIVFTLVLTGCEEDYACKKDPLGESCYIPMEDLDFESSVIAEYTIDEDFEIEVIGQKPENWLLYSDAEYEVNGVRAFVEEGEDGQYVKMYSDGKWSPMYPQNAPNPTFIFTTKFNLDKDRKGVAYGSVLIPSSELLAEGETNNSVTIGVSTGAVNIISITIGKDMKIFGKVGGPFFYYSGNNDGGDAFQTSYTANYDTWYRFKFEWDANENLVQAFIILDEQEVQLYSGTFHISARVNAEENGEILVPNVFKVTMPKYFTGWAFLDDVKVERRAD
ncbi:MAG: hypothetical protein PHX62_02750 [Bacilli bacterium]|nr:hypothetical protein [Bacilli bacterium]